MSQEEEKIYWHTSAHILAQAVKRLYKDVKLGIGPPIKEGFYYDFDFGGRKITEDDLQEIEKEIKKIITEKFPITQVFLDKKQAEELLTNNNQDYKLELLKEIIEEDKISFYKQGEFIDLCIGPHLSSTSQVKSFKLLSIAGAYWRGNEKNKMLTRIYGISFEDGAKLEEYIQRQEEARSRDHRYLGKELEIFAIYEDIGQGLVVYHPEGALLRFILEDFSKKEHIKRGYLPVISPHIGKLDLWEISGHYQMQYPMYFTKVEDKEYGIKPMNCPFHIYVYKSKIRSYRELPVRYFELGTVYRAERTGVLHGLLRVRGFTQDDAHIFCSIEQLDSEIKELLQFTWGILDKFSFKNFRVYLSTKPEKYIGRDEDWERATSSLEGALVSLNIDYQIDSQEGVFYGPKIDIKLEDTIGRLWQGPTIQLDFNLPGRFELFYIDKDGTPKTPVMLHRVIFGSLERFIAMLIENYKGWFPTWLAPCQVVIIPITKENMDYTKTIYDILLQNNLRVKIDGREETLSYRIRDNQQRKIPYILVIGKMEEREKTVSIRYKNKDIGKISLSEFLERILSEVNI